MPNAHARASACRARGLGRGGFGDREAAPWIIRVFMGGMVGASGCARPQGNPWTAPGFPGPVTDGETRNRTGDTTILSDTSRPLNGLGEGRPGGSSLARRAD